MCCGLFLAVPAAVTAFVAGYFCPRYEALLYGAGQLLQQGAGALGPLAQPLVYAASRYGQLQLAMFWLQCSCDWCAGDVNVKLWICHLPSIHTALHP